MGEGLKELQTLSPQFPSRSISAKDKILAYLI